jgi:hypothetical protein
MMTYVNQVAILDCIGFDLASRDSMIQVRFAKCLVHGDGRIERQYSNDKLMCHRVNFRPGDDIDAIMADECAQIAGLGYDPPTQEMIERIKAHCALEWGAMTIEPVSLAPAEPMEFVPFTDREFVNAN